MAQYLIKYIDSTGKKTVANFTDVFTIGGLKFGTNPQQYDDTTIALKSDLSSVSGQISLDFNNQLQALELDLENQLGTVSGILQDEIDYVSGVVDTILNDLTTADEERVEAVSGGQTIFGFGIAFDPSNANRDIEVTKNGLKMFQSNTGNISGGDFQKISANQIEFFYGTQLGDRVVLRLE